VRAQKLKKITARTAPEGRAAAAACDDDPVRLRIIDATFRVLAEHGYARASTRAIAKQAKVSKRELYALFGSKQAILAAMIAGRAQRMRQPLALPAVDSRTALAETLVRFGATLMREVCHPAVAELFRLAVVEAERSPELARALDQGGRQASRAALADLLAGAQAKSLIAGAEPATMASQFLALLWGDLQVSLLMRLAPAPGPAEIERRARAAAHALLTLYAARQ
jgi:AcrR family transcriptional regulator